MTPSGTMFSNHRCKMPLLLSSVSQHERSILHFFHQPDLKPCYSLIYNAIHAAYDLAPGKLALTLVIWQ